MHNWTKNRGAATYVESNMAKIWHMAKYLAAFYRRRGSEFLKPFRASRSFFSLYKTPSMVFHFFLPYQVLDNLEHFTCVDLCTGS